MPCLIQFTWLDYLIATLVEHIRKIMPFGTQNIIDNIYQEFAMEYAKKLIYFQVRLW